ncbi:MAG: radical SAM protein [Clostridiales bacterium]|nr:radical SAM protein [Clostridiales bacterium]
MRTGILINNSQNEIEIGPIRPPSEANSLLLRVTRNCSWNRCRFCGLYKGQRFSIRPVEEIKGDIDRIVSHRSEIAKWAAGGGDSVFLQDANTMALSYGKLREILEYLREKLPNVKRVTSYGRADSLARFSAEQMSGLKKAGLDRIHSGFESGSDKVLALINKGFTKEQEIEAGQKVKAAGIEFSMYYMPGVGGKALADDSAVETADVINKVNPDFVRVRTFVSIPGTGLMEDIQGGLIEECTDAEKAAELKKMIENVRAVDGQLCSDHMVNLFESVDGSMETDMGKMLSVFDAFEKLDAYGRRRYQLARRFGMVRGMDDMGLLDSDQRAMVDACITQLDGEDRFEEFLLKLLRLCI